MYGKVTVLKCNFHIFQLHKEKTMLPTRKGPELYWNRSEEVTLLKSSV